MSLGVPRKTGRAILPVLMLLILAAVVVGVIAAVILTQTAPTVPVQVAAPMITSTCTTLVPLPTTAPIGPGAIIFQCTSGAPGFHSTGTGTSFACVNPVTSTCPGAPASPYASLGYIPHIGGVCTIASPGTLVPVTPVNIPLGDYDYCAVYTNGATSGSSLPSFTVTWN